MRQLRVAAALIALSLAAPPALAAYSDIAAGDAAFDQKRYDEALRLFTKAIDEGGLDNEQFAEAYYSRGNAFRRVNKNRDAAADYRQALRLKPDYWEPQYNLGNALRDGGDTTGAIAAYTRAIAIRPNGFQPYVNRGNISLSQKRFKEALADFDRAIEIKPDFAIAWYNRGVVYAALRDRDAAIRNYRRAAELDPGYDKPKKALADLGID